MELSDLLTTITPAHASISFVSGIIVGAMVRYRVGNEKPISETRPVAGSGAVTGWVVGAIDQNKLPINPAGAVDVGAGLAGALAGAYFVDVYLARKKDYRAKR